MKANELRIGNYVYSGVDSKDVIEVYPMFFVQFSKIENEKHNIKPIPLTEEWLLKFGFEWKNHGLRLNNFCVRQEVNGFVIYLCNEAYNFKSELEYVHQLQNLYFALTGEELTINE